MLTNSGKSPDIVSSLSLSSSTIICHYHHHNHHHLSLLSSQPSSSVTINITTIIICHYQHHNHHHLCLRSSCCQYLGKGCQREENVIRELYGIYSHSIFALFLDKSCRAFSVHSDSKQRLFSAAKNISNAISRRKLDHVRDNRKLLHFLQYLHRSNQGVYSEGGSGRWAALALLPGASPTSNLEVGLAR